MQVEISNESTLRQFTAITSFEVKGIPDFRRPLTPTQTIRPERVHILFSRIGNGRWRSEKTAISGHRVLTTGHLGSPLTEDFSQTGMEKAPQWLHDTIQERLDVLNAELETKK